MITIRDVARRANVSATTVSYVINGSNRISDEVKKRVADVIEELGYKPNRTARNLARNNTKIIGFYGPDTEVMKSNIFFYELMSGILSAAMKADYNVIVYPEEQDENGELTISLDRGEPIDGAIIMNPRLSNQYLKKIVEKDLPFVLIGRPNEMQEAINYVDIDNVAIGYNAAKILLSRGHSSILFLNGPQNYTISVDRLEGYKMALSEHNVAFEEGMVVNCEINLNEVGEAVKQYLKNGIRFSAIIASSDIHAVGALNALEEFSIRVPKDVALVCESETFLTVYNKPKITGIKVNADIIGHEATTQLISILEKKLIKPSHRIVPFQMNMRETT